MTDDDARRCIECGRPEGSDPEPQVHRYEAAGKEWEAIRDLLRESPVLFAAAVLDDIATLTGDSQ